VVATYKTDEHRDSIKDDIFQFHFMTNDYFIFNMLKVIEWK